jgi:SAM-dependent methyltransferase
VRHTRRAMLERNAEPVDKEVPAGIGSLLAQPDLGVDVVRSPSELEAIRGRVSDRVALERLLCETLADRDPWTLEGVCRVCATAVEFTGNWKYSNGRILNFRELLVCPGCKLNNRMRFMAHLLLTMTRPAQSHAPTYLYEQVTPFFVWAERELPGRVIGSEYLGPDIASGTVVGRLRHEDALALSFADDSLDTIVSNDVFEHVPDIDRSLAECARVLRPGGRLCFSVPFDGRSESGRRAIMCDGEIVHLASPVYHGNPIDPNGSLVFYDHGLDILERCRQAGFADAFALGYWSLLYGYLGRGMQLMFVAEKADPAKAFRRR